MARRVTCLIGLHDTKNDRDRCTGANRPYLTFSLRSQEPSAQGAAGAGRSAWGESPEITAAVRPRTPTETPAEDEQVIGRQRATPGGRPRQRPATNAKMALTR